MMSRCLANRVRSTFVLSHTNSLHHGARDAESLVVVSCSEATVGGSVTEEFGQACILESAAMVDESARGVGSSYLDGYADYYSAAPGVGCRDAIGKPPRSMNARLVRRLIVAVSQRRHATAVTAYVVPGCSPWRRRWTPAVCGI